VRKSTKLKKLQKQMLKALNYEEWKSSAIEHDELSGAKRWREVDQSTQYDYAQIRLRLDRLRSLRARHDHQGLVFTLNEGIHGNMGGMGRSTLYRKANFGTKRLIEQYLEEVDDALRYLAELPADKLDIQDKLDFFYRANICFGRSALMLSGGGVLGFYHLGVVKTLLEQGLLPRVISGSSAGSLVAGVVGTHTEAELEHFYEPANVHFEAEREASVFSRMFFGAKPQIDVGDLERLIARMIPDMTFQEAYEKTGRQISITVAPAEPHQRSRLLNAITSPNVFVRSAVMASCAVPGVFPPVMLMAKNVHGEAQPYLPTRRWVDGSIADDLPAKRLSRLYSTNHYIVSMVNPIVTPFIDSEGERSPMARSLSGFGVGVGREILNLYRGVVQKQGDNWPRFNMAMNTVHALIDQDYSGDINIVPNFRWYNPGKLLSHLSEKDLMDLMEEGERTTYPQVETIRLCTLVSRTMEDILHRFESGDLRPDIGEYHRPRSSRRRPPPTRSDREAMREHRVESGAEKKPAPRKKAARKKSTRSATVKSSTKGSSKGSAGSSSPRTKAA
jgi:TAG lipase / steryl ester hydrolase / phospholipase A2 / LPA acyltransferase